MTLVVIVAGSNYALTGELGASLFVPLVGLLVGAALMYRGNSVVAFRNLGLRGAGSRYDDRHRRRVAQHEPDR